MNTIAIFHSYFHYLIHPFKTHESFMYPDLGDGYKPMRLNPYESLTASWFFVIINAIFRMITLNFMIVFLLDLLNDSSVDYARFINLTEFPSLYFIVLSSILDIIFFPLFGFFVIQFWEATIKIYGNLLGVSGDLAEKASDIIAVSYSSHLFKIVPVFGSPLQSLSGMILMYAGLRKQLNASPVLSVCIILTPVLILMLLASFLVIMSLFIMQF